MLANLRAPLIATVACVSAWGCSHEQGPTVRVPPDFPADPAAVHPWIRSFAGTDVVQAQKMLQARLEEPNSPELTQLASCLADFTPERIDRHGNSYYLVCVRQTTNLTTLSGLGDQLYIAQPLPEAVIANRIEYFDESIRPQIRSFYWRYAGSGEEMEGEAGQFSLHHEATAGQHLAACLDVLDPTWEDARLFYFARSGDTLYLNRQGATAWHDAEADEFVPLFDTFPEFVRHYAQFRGTSEVFDSWTSYQFLLTQAEENAPSSTAALFQPGTVPRGVRPSKIQRASSWHSRCSTAPSPGATCSWPCLNLAEFATNHYYDGTASIGGDSYRPLREPPIECCVGLFPFAFIRDETTQEPS